MTLVLAVGLAATLNPYGPANLTMPFRQVSASAITTQSTDWVPLLNMNALHNLGFFQPLDVGFFLVTLFLAGALLAAGIAAVMAGSGTAGNAIHACSRRSADRYPDSRYSRPDGNPIPPNRALRQPGHDPLGGLAARPVGVADPGTPPDHAPGTVETASQLRRGHW